jgi:muramidase (phage lysozyme)
MSGCGSLGSETNCPKIDSGTSVRTRSPSVLPLGNCPDQGIGTDYETANQLLRSNIHYLNNPNVAAFLNTLSVAEGGDYDLMYGAVRAKQDRWHIQNYATHPGFGRGGKSSAAGRYQINKDTWADMGGRMGLSDFYCQTQDLIAIEILRAINVLDALASGDLNRTLEVASRRWAALPAGPGKAGRYNQPYMQYEVLIQKYKSYGGAIAGEK